MTFIVDDNLKVSAIIAASSNSIGADGQVLASNGSVIYWTDTAGDVPGANGQILFHYNEQLQANSTLYFHYANNTLEVSGNVVIANIVTFNSNKHLILPKGTSSQRDGAPIEGHFRYNTDLNNLEWYNGTSWQQAGTSVGEENQRAFSDVSADTGTAASVLKTDTLTVNGANGVSTSATGTTLNINVQPGHNKLTSNTTGLWIESGNINTSELNNDVPFSTTVGTVTSVGITSGNLIDVSGGPVTGSGNITVNVDLSELTTSTSDNDGDFFAVVDASNVQRKLTKSNINLSGFNNDSSFSSTVGTVTEVTGGNGLTVTNGTTTPDLDIGQGNGIFVTADNINVQVGNNQLIANTTGLWVNNAAITDLSRSSISVTDSGGDGSLTYTESTGVITYTGPSAAEVRAHFSEGEGINIAAGVISGEDATTTNKGIASFDSNHFTVTTGAVSIAADSIDDTLIDFGTGANQVNTDDLPEGSTNLYYTNASVDSHLSGTSGVNYSSGNITAVGANGILVTTDGINVKPGDSLLIANTTGLFINNTGSGSGLDADLLDGQEGSYYLNTSTSFGGDVSGTYNNIQVTDDSHNHIIDNVDGLQSALDLKAPLASPALTGTTTAVNLTISGDLTVNGTTSTINSDNINVANNLIELNSGLTGANPNDTGIIIERGSSGDNAFIGWDESADQFILGTTTATGDSTGNLTVTSGTIQADITGTAADADALGGTAATDYLKNTDGANGIVIINNGINVQTGNTQLVANTTGLWLNSGAVNISEFVNDVNFSSTVGTVTSIGITPGNLIDVSGSPITDSGNITVDVDLSELTTSTSDDDGDFFAVVDASNVQRKLTKANINLSGFNNDANFVDYTSTPLDNQIAVFTDTNTIEGDANFTWNGTVLDVTGQFNIDNVRIDGNVLSTTNTDGDLTITPDGKGYIQFSGNTIILPTGITANRPQNAGDGQLSGALRFNTTDNIIEWYNGSGWIQPGEAGGQPNQNAYGNLSGDSGTATADSDTDEIIFTGGNGISTTVSDTGGNDTVTIDADVANGILVTTDGINVKPGDSLLIANTTGLWVNNAAITDISRSSISVTDSGGDGSLTYIESTGVITYTGPSAAEARAHFSAGEGIDLAAGVISGENASTSNKGIASFDSNHFTVTTGAVSIAADSIDDTLIDFGTGANQVNTDDLPEGSTNLYYTDSLVDSHLSGTSGVNYSSGNITAVGANGILVTTDGVNVQPGHNKLTSNTTGLWIESGNINTSELNNDAQFVDYVNTPLNNQIAIFTDTNTIEGDANFTWSGTVLDVTGQFNIDNVRIDGNVLSTTDTDGDLTITPDGKGYVQFSGNTIILPTGITANRPANAGDGLLSGSLRFNTTDNIIEWYNGSAWIRPGAAGGESNEFSFKTIEGDTGSAVADTSTDILSITGGNGITTTASDGSPDNLNIVAVGANGILVTSQGINVQTGNTQLIANTTGLWINQITESQISDLQSYLTSYTETDPIVAAINGIVKSNGSLISAAVAGTDYLTDVSQDTTPQLGSNLDAQNNDITNLGTINTHTIPGGTGTFALTSDLTGGTVTASNGVDDRVAVFSSAGNIDGDANFIWLDQRLTITGNTATSYLELTNGIVANGFLGTTDQVLTSNSTGGAFWQIASGSSSVPINDVFYENNANVTSSYTITTNKNALSAGPITIDSGVIVTVPADSQWTVVG